MGEGSELFEGFSEPHDPIEQIITAVVISLAICRGGFKQDTEAPFVPVYLSGLAQLHEFEVIAVSVRLWMGH